MKNVWLESSPLVPTLHWGEQEDQVVTREPTRVKEKDWPTVQQKLDESGIPYNFEDTK